MSGISQPADFNVPHYSSLAQIDPEVNRLIHEETWRQYSVLDLIASLNVTSCGALEANGSIYTNKFFGGVPGTRFYGGDEDPHALQNLCQQRALKAFDVDPAIWGVNVQPYSGSLANLAVFTALAQPQDRIMGLGMSDGGHRTHGFHKGSKKMSATSIYFQTLPYSLDCDTQLIDYANLRHLARIYKPQIILCGACAYTREWDYKTLRKIADEVGAWLVGDVAHAGGLIIAGEMVSPFEQCDVITTTTHKTLRGPRAGLIFYRKDKKGAEDLESRINDAVYPGCQGSPHDNVIAAIATTLHLAMKPEFKVYAKQVIANAKLMASELLKLGYVLQTGGTDCHMIIWDLRPTGLNGSELEILCEHVGIIVNKCPISGDDNAPVHRGVRIGSATLTSRSVAQEQFKTVTAFLHRCVELSLLIQKEAESKTPESFYKAATAGNSETVALVHRLKKEVQDFARRYPLPGVDVSTLKKLEEINKN